MKTETKQRSNWQGTEIMQVLPIASQNFSRYSRYTRNIIAEFINSTISRGIPGSVLWNTMIHGMLCDKTWLWIILMTCTSVSCCANQVHWSAAI